MHLPIRNSDRSRSAPSAQRLWRRVVLVIGLVLQTPAVFAGLSSAELQQRSKEVESMTAIEREGLKRNWRAFQSLPQDRKQRYRQLHQQLENDRKSNNQLNHTMQTYAAWLQTLTPGQRADLRQATNSVDKLALVKQIKRDQEFRNETRALSEPAEDFSRNRWKALQGKAGPLTSAELNALFDALAGLLPASDREELSRLDAPRDKWIRYRRIIQMSAREAGGPQEWPSSDQQAAIVASISKSEQANRLKNFPDPQQRRGRWGMVIFSSISEELLKEHAPFQPKPEDLEHLFESMLNVDREALMRLPTDQMRRELMRKYSVDQQMSNNEFREFQKMEHEFRGFAWRFMSEAGFFGRGGPPGMGGGRFGPPRNGRDGRDGPPPGDRDFRRPRGDGDRRPPE